MPRGFQPCHLAPTRKALPADIIYRYHSRFLNKVNYFINTKLSVTVRVGLYLGSSLRSKDAHFLLLKLSSYQLGSWPQSSSTHPGSCNEEGGLMIVTLFKIQACLLSLLCFLLRISHLCTNSNSNSLLCCQLPGARFKRWANEGQKKIKRQSEGQVDDGFQEVA